MQIVHAVLGMDVGFSFTNSQCFCMWHCIWGLAKGVYLRDVFLHYSFGLFIEVFACICLSKSACGSNLTFIYGTVGLWVSYFNIFYVIRYWDGMLFMCSLHAMMIFFFFFVFSKCRLHCL